MFADGRSGIVQGKVDGLVWRKENIFKHSSIEMLFCANYREDWRISRSLVAFVVVVGGGGECPVDGHVEFFSPGTVRRAIALDTRI